MPSRRTHKTVEEALFGKAAAGRMAYVGEWKDRPARYMGRSHRRVRHDHASNLELAIRSGDPAALIYGEVHDAVDKSVSAMKTEMAKATGLPRWLVDLMLNV